MAQGEFALVTEHLEKAIPKASTLISDVDLYAMLADAAVQLHDEDALRKYAPILEESANDFEHKLYLATAHRAWGVFHRLEGDYELAEERLQQAAAIFRGLDTRWQLGRTHFELGELAAKQDALLAAKQFYGQALSFFEELGAGPDAAKTRAAIENLSTDELRWFNDHTH